MECFNTDNMVKEDIITPKRYTGNNLECWDFWIKAELHPLIASAVKYVWRYKDKNGKQDLLKSLVFLDKMLATPVEQLYFTRSDYFAESADLNNMSDIQQFIVNTSVQTTHRGSYRIAINDMILAIKHIIKTEYGDDDD